MVSLKSSLTQPGGKLIAGLEKIEGIPQLRKALRPSVEPQAP